MLKGLFARDIFFALVVFGVMSVLASALIALAEVWTLSVAAFVLGSFVLALVSAAVIVLLQKKNE